MATATLHFDKSSYTPAEDIHFTVTVDVPMSSTLTVVGTATMPSGAQLPAQSTTTVRGLYGPFTAAGYRIVQDPTDPSRFTATPVV